MKPPDQRELLEALLAGILASLIIAGFALAWLLNQ
jgi:hypothetical protein